ncbi:hypothetical protein Bca101_046590 [Brassica carinata]
MMSFEMNDRKKIGLGLTAFGVFFSFLGIMFVFDKGLLAMGNILFISGVSLTIGLKSTMQFFTKRQNYKCFHLSAASGQPWQFSYKRYLFSAGSFSYLIFDLSLTSTGASVCPSSQLDREFTEREKRLEERRGLDGMCL